MINDYVEEINNLPYQQRKQIDIENEKIVHQWLLDNFYKDGVETVTDRNTQIKGADAIYGDMVIDEKTAIHWANRNLKYAAFSISQIDKNGNEYKSWFADENNITTHYLFVYLDDVLFGDDFLLKRINQATIYFCPKKAVCEHIGIEIDTLYHLSEKMRCGAIKRLNCNDWWFQHSTHYKESTVNVMMMRETLEKISIKRTITNDEN